ncbi:MAG TPA: NDP-sugar synthase [Solirubrobacteraceae bacterium]
MQALILAGGEGTRLRPLTSTVPKPVVPLVDRPFIAFMLDWLRGHGVDDVVLSCGYLASGVHNVLGDGAAYGLRLRYVEEPEPLGTGGAVKLAEPLLAERFLMLNGDTLTDLDLTAQVRRHEELGAQATLGLVPVEDPSAFGLVRTADDGHVLEFLEKPSPDQIDTNLVSGGVYVVERAVLDLMPASGPCSIERDIFPRLIGHGLFGLASDAYWLDIGTPARYLQATFDILEGEVQTPVRDRMGAGYRVVEEEAEIEGRVIPPALIERGCRIADGAHVGSRVVLGRAVTVGPGAVVEQSVVLDGADIGPGSHVAGCIIGAGARVGPGCTLREGVVLGEGVTLGADNELRAGARLFPGVRLGDGAIRF